MPLKFVSGIRVLVGTGSLVAMAISAQAQTPVESSSEIRFQLDVVVPQAALTPFIPPGFTMNVSTAGAAKDCNLRVVFIDRITINAPDGKPLGKGSNRLVYLAAPVKDASGANAQLVIGGLTADPADAPGPFGNYLPASTATLKRTISAEGTDVTETQEWLFRAASGETLEMSVAFARGVEVRRTPTETKFYSAKNPTRYLISKEERVMEIVRNATTNPPDKVKQFRFKGSGGSYAKLFDGTERTVSWDNNIWMLRTVSVP